MLKNQAKINSLLIPFGFKDGKMFEPSQVDNGAACGCICSECKAPLTAKANKKDTQYKVRPYFAHANNYNCTYAIETAIHHAAKQLIEQHRKLYIPERLVSVSKIDALNYIHIRSKRLHSEGLMEFNNVWLEKYVTDINSEIRIKPDIRATNVNGIEFIIEIAVTNPVDEQKIKKIHELGLPAIQIDLSKFISFDFNVLSKILFEPFEGTKWLFHPQDNTAINSLHESLEPTLARAKKDADLHRFFDLRRLQARDAEREKQEKIVLERKQKEEERAKKFKMLNSRQKLEKILKYLKIEEQMTPWFLNKKVNGEDSFEEGRKIWQLAIFAQFIHRNKDKSFNQAEVLDWIKLRFKVVEKFTNSEKVALWQFLSNLCEIGILKHTGKQQFEIIANNLHELIAWNIQPPLNSKTIQLDRFKWASDWPYSKHTNLVAQKYQRKYGKLDWNNIATLFPSARNKSIDEIASLYASGRLEDKDNVIMFFIEAKFIIKNTSR